MSLFNHFNDGLSELDKYLQYHSEIGNSLFQNDKNRCTTQASDDSKEADTSLETKTGELQ